MPVTSSGFSTLSSETLNEQVGGTTLTQSSAESSSQTSAKTFSGSTAAEELEEEDAIAALFFEEDTTIEVEGGQVTTLELDSDREIASIEIIDLPDIGNVTVNPDNSLALVLSGSDYSGALSFDFKVTFADGSSETQTAKVQVAEPEQAAGWGKGKHYMLEVDTSGDLVIETGENHRKVYVSGSEDALTRADIAAIEGVSTSQITNAWLAASDYGTTEDTALAKDLGMSLWYSLNPLDGEPSSDWLLFEKGYTYEDTGRLIYRGISGEDPLHPIYISSWGEGDKPVLTDQARIYQAQSANIVFDDISLDAGISSLSGSNILMNNVDVTGGGAMDFQYGDGITIRESTVTNAVTKKPDAEYWSDTKAGIYIGDVSGILMEDNIFYHNGWEDGYFADGSTEGGMPANMFSHNVYLQNTTTDVTFRDNITAQGASYGAQLRGGAFVEDNVFLDNNANLSVFGGVYKGDGPIANFSFVADNLVTSGAHLEMQYGSGAMTLGILDLGYSTTFLDNIVAHLADPNNPDEQAEKTVWHPALSSENGADYNDTIYFNWGYQTNNSGIDEAVGNATTIQLYAAALLNDPNATITDLMEYIVDKDGSITAEDILTYFQNGFGVGASGDGGATTHRFIPNALADGIRWDNRINWSNEELPDSGDNVELGGNWVQYGGTTRIEDLDMGSGGRLEVNSGKLTVEGTLSTGTAGGSIEILNAGQFWTNGYAGEGLLDIDVSGGRFANIGTVSGATALTATNGQTLLATGGGSYVLTSGSTLEIIGIDVTIGFDNDDADESASLIMTDGSTLSFSADAAGFSTLNEFRSGRWDIDAPQVQSTVSLDGTLTIDLTDYTGGVANYDLVQVDELVGALDAFDVTGLGSNYDVTIVANYKTDKVILKITEGSGVTSLTTRGEIPEALVPVIPEPEEVPDTTVPTPEPVDPEVAEPETPAPGPGTVDPEDTGESEPEQPGTTDPEEPGTVSPGPAPGPGNGGGNGNAARAVLEIGQLLDGTGYRKVKVGGPDGHDKGVKIKAINSDSALANELGLDDDGASSYRVETREGANDQMAKNLADIALSDTSGLSRSALNGDVVDRVLKSSAIVTNANKIIATEGDDVFVGVGGNETVKAGAGNDVMRGKAGNDKLYGNADNDILRGHKGVDLLFGGHGDDILYGGKGNDTLTGGQGDDELSGRKGQDTFVFGRDHGDDTITDFNIGRDVIEFSFKSASMNRMSIEASGDDTLVTTGHGTITLLDVDFAELNATSFLF